MASRFLKKIKHIIKEPFIKKVVNLAGWTVISQGIYFIGLPFISRLYDVETFGNLSILQSISSLLITVSAFRYEAAIILPKDDDIAFNLLFLSLLLLCISTFTVSIVLFFTSNILFVKKGFSILLQFWWLIPFYQFGAGLYEILINWAVRKDAFHTIGYTKITQTCSMIAIQIGLALAKFGQIGLYIGDIFGRSSGAGSLIGLIWFQDKRKIKKIEISKIIYAAKQYKSFPMYSILAIILSILGRNFIPVAIAGTYGVGPAGFYAMASRVIAAPVELLCRSYTQVYLGEAARLANEDPKRLKILFKKSTRYLLSIAIVPSLTLLIVGPQLFSLVLGPQWKDAGIYARCMSIMVLFQFVNFPLVHTLNIVEKQNWQLVWDGVIFIFGIGGIYIIYVLGFRDVYAVLYYSCFMSVMFMIHYFISLLSINLKIKRIEN